MRVGVVGLGLAGLRTAMLLEQAGVEVLLFEARDRPGGRLWTVEGESGPLYEAGGEWIDADHFRVLALLREMALVPRPTPEESGIVVYQGERRMEDDLWDDALETDSVVETRAQELCGGLRTPAWDNPEAAGLDSLLLSRFLQDLSKSERGHFWVASKYRADEGEDPDHIGLLGWLAGFNLYTQRQGDELAAYRLPGGTNELCAFMLARVKALASYGRVLRQVKQDRGGVSLVFERESVYVDQVVLTLPPPCLKQVEFEPSLPEGKSLAIDACEMGRIVKIFWQFRTPWWRELSLSGSIVSDGPLQTVWDASIGEIPVLCAYVCGRDAQEWARGADPVRDSLARLTELYPVAGKCFVSGRLHDWSSDRFALGGFSHMKPGYVLNHLRFIATPASRVHFAGEHTATWTGFMEGALESAERVTEEILAAG